MTYCPRSADDLDANLIVMGARDLGRVERLLRQVDAEPVLARAHRATWSTFARPPRLEAPRAAGMRPTPGIAAVNLDEAVVAPEAAFGSPQQVVERDELSVTMRRWILQAWAHDVEAADERGRRGRPRQSVQSRAAGGDPTGGSGACGPMRTGKLAPR